MAVEDELVDVQQFIGGRWRDGGGEPTSGENPAVPGEEVVRLTTATTADADEAVRAARDAHGSWARQPLAQRGEVLVRAADVLDENAEAFGRELTREEGKTLPEGIGEVRRAAQIFRFFAGEALREVGEMYASPRAQESIWVERRPRGVVAAITPWNFPIAIPAWKLAPALVYGNTVVWKPASNVPLLAVRLTQALEAGGLPNGVLSLVMGPGHVGEHLALHDGVDAVTFTGSTGVGRRLIASCGQLARPVQTEMGGKNAAIVLRDAAVAESAQMVLSAALGSTGQKCTATERLILEKPIAADFLDELAHQVGEWSVGNGLDSGIRMGPAVSAQAQASIMGAVKRARHDGCEMLVGGEPYGHGPLSKGAFVPPTVLMAETTAEVWREEVFGPVLAVRVVESADEALALANDSPYGLSASVFTNDLRQVQRATEALQVGLLHVNSGTTGAEPHVPFGGVKQSGYGPHEQGRSAREFFTETMTVYQRPLASDSA